MKIGFLGCGSMGGAVARAVSQVTKDIVLTDRSGKGKVLANELGIGYGSAEEIALDCDWIFLAVKPQMMEGALSPIRLILQGRRPLLVTMAAGLSMEKIETLAGGRPSIAATVL